MSQVALFVHLPSCQNGSALQNIENFHETRPVAVAKADVIDQLRPVVLALQRLHDGLELSQVCRDGFVRTHAGLREMPIHLLAIDINCPLRVRFGDRFGDSVAVGAGSGP